MSAYAFKNKWLRFRVALSASVFALLVIAALPVTPAQAAPASAEDLAAYKELQQTKLDALKELHQKDVDALRQRADAVDKRIDDQATKMGQGVDRLGVYASVLGMLITVLLAGLGLIGYFTVTKRTKEEAQDAAKEWFDEQAKNLQARIAELGRKAEQVHQQMDAIVQDVKTHGETTKDQIFETLQTEMGKPDTHEPHSAALQEALQQVQKLASELKKKPESSYSFEDWNTKAHAAYGNKQWEDAANFWLKASEIPNAGAISVAVSLFNRGVAQGQLNQSEAAIATYDELLRRFGDATEPALRELVANALVNKGIAQSQLNQSEAEIATYDELLRRFGDATEPALRKLVANALVNKGIAQKSQLNQSEAAIATYDEVIRRFGDTTESALRERVASAWNGKGFDKLMHAKKMKELHSDQATAYLRQSLADLEQAMVLSPQVNGVVLGNRAYVHWLLGNAPQAEADFAQALRAPRGGGKFLYEATLKDLAMHPIPEDQGMRELVEREWVKFQNENPN